MTTMIYAEVLRAALKRNGVWFVDIHGNPTDFYHRQCLKRICPASGYACTNFGCSPNVVCYWLGQPTRPAQIGALH